MTIKIKANEQLFNWWRNLGLRVSSLSSIVQNDMESEVMDIVEWQQLYRQTEEQLKLVYQETMDYLQANDESFTYQLFTHLGKEQES